MPQKAATGNVTGYGYFENVIPSDWFAFLKTHNIYALDTMLWWMTGFISLKCFGSALAMARPRRTS